MPQPRELDASSLSFFVWLLSIRSVGWFVLDIGGSFPGRRESGGVGFVIKLLQKPGRGVLVDGLELKGLSVTDGWLYLAKDVLAASVGRCVLSVDIVELFELEFDVSLRYSM